MRRRTFLSRAGAAAGSAALVAAPAIAQGLRELKLVTSWPRGSPGLSTSADRFARILTEISAGRLQVRVFHAAELVNALEAFDAVSSGVADMYHSAEYYWQDRSPAFSYFAAVPFGFTANEINAWVYQGGGQELWDELSAGFNLKSLLCSNTGVQMGGWFGREVTSLDSYKGLRYRMPGMGGEVLRRLGATVVNLAGGEIVPALRSGAIDAAEWVGPWNDLELGLHTAVKFYYYPGFHEPGTALSLGINKRVWDGLNSDQRQMIAAAAAAENSYSIAEFNAKNTVALERLVNEHGVQVRKIEDSILEGLGTLSGEVLVELSKRDAMSRRVFDSYIKFRRATLRWGDLSERGYLNARGLKYRYGD